MSGREVVEPLRDMKPGIYYHMISDQDISSLEIKKEGKRKSESRLTAFSALLLRLSFAGRF
jgi:hypothetical protein